MNMMIQAPEGDVSAMHVGLTIARQLLNEGWHESGKGAAPRKDVLNGWAYDITSGIGDTGLVVMVETR